MHNEYTRLLTSGLVLHSKTPRMIQADDFMEKHNLGFSVYRVEGLSELHREYLSNPTHENYMQLVDVVNEIMGGCGIDEFFIHGQAYNSSITPLTTCLIEDILSGKFAETHLKYAVATSGMKVSLLANLSRGVKLENQFKSAWSLNGKPSMNLLLSKLITDKEVFMSFLRYVFID